MTELTDYSGVKEFDKTNDKHDEDENNDASTDLGEDVTTVRHQQRYAHTSTGPTRAHADATDLQNAMTLCTIALIYGVGKGLDANRYATKKTVAQGMLDIALLTSNASQLKYVLQVGPKHEFYHMLLILISLSIVLQVAMGVILLTLNLLRDCRFHLPRHRTSALNINYATTAIAFVVTVLNVLASAFDSSLLVVGLMFVFIGGLDLNDDDDQPSAIILNDVIVIFIFIISVTNIVISAFGIEYSNSPLVLERLKYINEEYLRKGNLTSV